MEFIACHFIHFVFVIVRWFVNGLGMKTRELFIKLILFVFLIAYGLYVYWMVNNMGGFVV